jgi:hypothetical protein
MKSAAAASRSRGVPGTAEQYALPGAVTAYYSKLDSEGQDAVDAARCVALHDLHQLAQQLLRGWPCAHAMHAG